MRIDAFSHILPPKYKASLYKQLPASGFYRRESVESHPTLWDIEERLKLNDSYPDVRQVLTITIPPLEILPDAKMSAELARRGNEELAEIVTKYPDRFAAGVATLPMNDIDAALLETDRAIGELGLKGIQLYTNINGKPLDRPEFMPLYEKMAQYDLPIWLHPRRDASTPDYSTETRSEYRLASAVGWPYETTAAMTRLIFSGVFDRHPAIKFITHHCGGMIPFFVRRLANTYVLAEKIEHAEYMERLSKTPTEYYRMFYNDTAVCGHLPALMCGYAFFGADKLLFGTDAPYDIEHGHERLREAIQCVDQMGIPDAERQMILEDNVRKLLHL